MTRTSLRSSTDEETAGSGAASALERGISLLRCFTADVRELSNTALSRQTGIQSCGASRSAISSGAISAP